MTKRSISFRPEIWAEIVKLTGEEGGQVSALVNSALLYYLKVRRGLMRVAEWEASNAPLTAEELAEADKRLDQAGVGRSSPAAP
ncbi:MAG: hypothetical protein FJZ01_27470 [Candidatus Sericytochromatia bacterium]|nr:hypothetical protein [Candidatus Tanganyikabacteria bacterium]